MQTYRDLVVWQKAVELTTDIYNVTGSFPAHEQYGLTSQMRRAAVSIPSNIAEGKLRGSRAEWKRFLRIAFGSGAELETQLEIARRLTVLTQKDYQRVGSLLAEVMRMLNVMIAKASA